MSTTEFVAGVGLSGKLPKSRWPARMDLAQSASGLILGLFMWGHMMFVSTILVSNDLMWKVTKLFEGYFFFGRSHTGLVSAAVAGVLGMVVGHAFLAMRKFPSNHGQYRAFLAHKKLMRHGDTSLWWTQVMTGFALFFLASVHLYQMLMHPEDIGPYGSADRVWSGMWWPMYLVMLFAVELHGGIGLYRLAVKWGWLAGENPNATRARLKALKWVLTAFFLGLGLATLGAYMKIGHAHRDQVGARYTPPGEVATPEGASR